jgi:hypothetical protein
MKLRRKAESLKEKRRAEQSRAEKRREIRLDYRLEESIFLCFSSWNLSALSLMFLSERVFWHFGF